MTMTFPLENIIKESQQSDSWPKICTTHVGMLRALMLAEKPISVHEIAELTGISPQSVQRDITLIPGVIAEHAQGWKLNRERAQIKSATNRFVYALERARP